MSARVFVDVVEPGRALITGPGFSGRVGRDGPRRFYVEDSDTEKLIAVAVRSYRAAGEAMARAHNLTDYTITVDHERG